MAEGEYVYCPIVIEDNGRLDVSVQINFEGYHYVGLLDQNYEVIKREFMDGKGAASPTIINYSYYLTPGTYYVRVESYNGSQGFFKIKATFEKSTVEDENTNINFQTALPYIEPQVSGFLSSLKSGGMGSGQLPERSQNFADYESGQTKLDETVCSIADIVNETSVIIGDQALEKNQKFTTDISQIQNLYVYCDKLRIKEILVNLLGNSVKYTQIGGQISLRILQLPSEKEGYGNYEIHVKDNGCGMSNALNREIAVAILENAGFLVETAENGAVAVEKVCYAPVGYYAAVLMDIQMPVMDGYGATRAIRRLEDREKAKVPVIAVSANAFDEDREASRAAGMNGHLAKPIIAADLLEMLGKIIQGL